MFVKRFAALCASASFMCVSQVNAQELGKPDCWRADELAAARVGTLQSLLMVQALKCQETSPTTLAAYNKFMADKHDIIVRDKYLIQAHFVRQYGPNDGLKASAAYDTKLGNQSSSPIVSVAECEKAGTYSRLASAAGEEDMLVLATMVGAAAPMQECSAPAAVAAKPAAMVIPVWTRPAPAVPSAAPVARGAEPAVAVIAPGAHPMAAVALMPAPVSGPVPVPTPAPAMVRTVTVTPAPAPAGPPSNADAVKALQAAVAALSQVAATLQPAPGAAKPVTTQASFETEE